MTALVTLDQAKAHLRVEHNADNDDIQLKINAASVAVVNYCKTTDAQGWDETTAPADVQNAVLLLLGDFYKTREGGDPSNDVALGYFPVPVTALLHRYRDPALA